MVSLILQHKKVTLQFINCGKKKNSHKLGTEMQIIQEKIKVYH